MVKTVILALCLAASGCAIFGGDLPPGASPLSQQTIHGLPPDVWVCLPNREPTCQ